MTAHDTLLRHVETARPEEIARQLAALQAELDQTREELRLVTADRDRWRDRVGRKVS